jgi:hypothetical protein
MKITFDNNKLRKYANDRLAEINLENEAGLFKPTT